MPPDGPPSVPLSPFWEKLKIVGPTAATILLAVFGYLATGRITTAIQTRQLELTHVKEMREVYLRLQTGASDPESTRAEALTLAAFRDYAIVPLLLVVERGTPYDDAAKAGLRAVALTDSEKVARQMLRVITNRSGAYSWRTHRVAVELLGELGWRAARPALESYRESLSPPVSVADATARLTAWTAASPAAPVEDDVPILLASLDKAIETIPKERTWTSPANAASLRPKRR